MHWGQLGKYSQNHASQDYFWWEDDHGTPAVKKKMLHFGRNPKLPNLAPPPTIKCRRRRRLDALSSSNLMGDHQVYE